MQPIAFYAKRSFSWKKGILHGLAVIVVFMVLGMIFAATGAFGDDAGKIGEQAGGQMFLASLLAIVASYGFQTEKKGLGAVMLGLVGLLLVYQIVGFIRIARDQADSAPLTAAERQRPAPARSQTRLCHPALGFSFPDPGPSFGVSEALEERSGAADTPANLGQWMWENEDTGERILVQVIKGVGRTESSFRDFAAGLKRGFTKNGRASIETESLQWNAGRGEFNLTASAPNGAHVESRCLARGPQGYRPPIAVCVQTIVGTGDPLREIRAGLDVVACAD
jgi:hypothetical protein